MSRELEQKKNIKFAHKQERSITSERMSVSQKVVSPASANSGNVMRNGLAGNCVRPKRSGSVSQRSAHVSSKRSVDVIERLREQIKCIEARTPVLDSTIEPPSHPEPRPAVFPPGQHDENGSLDQRTYDAPPSRSGALNQAGFPVIRLVDEDGGASPRTPLPPAPPSSSLSHFVARQAAVSESQTAPQWTLARLDNSHQSIGSNKDAQDITQLSLDIGGVHEIKPALHLNGAAPSIDWAASWSAARAFSLSLIARLAAGCHEAHPVHHASAEPSLRSPILWCMPRGARAEHGVLYSHGLKNLGLSPADVLIVETSNTQDTLWVLEEAIKSGSLALVAGVLDDVMLTPARRLALATQKHNTPCLLLTHPRTSPAGATATRWRVAAGSSAAHDLSASHSLSTAGTTSRHFKAPGARRFALTLERCRSAPEQITRNVIGRENLVEWSDEAICFSLAAGLSDRSYAPRAAPIGASRSVFRAG